MTLSWKEFEPLKNKEWGTSRFFAMVKKDLDIENNPKADKMLEIAWDIGHAYGYNEVYIHAQRLVELIR